jgi:hypothetical protein
MGTGVTEALGDRGDVSTKWRGRCGSKDGKDAETRKDFCSTCSGPERKGCHGI